MKTRSLADARSPSANATFSCCWARSVSLSMRILPSFTLRCAAAGLPFARAAEAESPLLLQPGVHLLPSVRAGVIHPHHKAGIHLLPPLILSLEVQGQVVVLGGEPEGADLLQRCEDLVRRSLLRGHQLRQR